MSVVRSALAGLATGGRTFSGISALTATAPRDATEQPDVLLGKPQTQAVLGLLAAGEALADKLPAAPSRLDFPGIHGRVLAGAVCGVVVARRSATVTPELPGERSTSAAVAPGRPGVPPARVAVCALVGAAAAVAGSYGGARFRSWASSKTRHDWIGAVLEDAVVVTLTAAAVRAPGPAT